LLGSQPFGPCTPLALGAVPIATGVVTDPFRPATHTLFNMPAQRGSATLGDRPQDPRLLVRDGMRGPKRRAVRPDDVGNFKEWR
jgi:hypothetical protein